MSARTPIKCPICAKSNKVSGLRKLLAYRARRSGEIPRAKIWRHFAREDLAKFRARRCGDISRAKMWRNFAREDVAKFRARFRAKFRAISHATAPAAGRAHITPETPAQLRRLSPNRFEKNTQAEFTRQKLAHMVAQDATVRSILRPFPAKPRGSPATLFARAFVLPPS